MACVLCECSLPKEEDCMVCHQGLLSLRLQKVHFSVCVTKYAKVKAKLDTELKNKIKSVAATLDLSLKHNLNF